MTDASTPWSETPGDEGSRQPTSPVDSPIWHVLWRRPSSAGLALALFFFVFSLTPTLIPRSPMFQGVASGMSMISGYALGATVGWVFRRIELTWEVAISRVWRWVGVGVAVVIVVVMLALGAGWQNDIRDLMGIPRQGPAYAVVLPLALFLAVLFLAIGRIIRLAAVALGRLIGRWMPRKVATGIAAAAVTVFVLYLASGVLWEGLLDGMRATASVNDRDTPSGIEQPAVAERSGSPASPLAWDTLGRQGRVFVGSGRTVEELSGFHQSIGSNAVIREPIRVYAGLKSTANGEIDEAAALVVEELHRTNAWDRKVLVVTTTTGTGWVDPGMSEAVELLHGGDTAIAAMQYSFLPSWVAFLSDRPTPPTAGRALFEAVYEAWSEQPEESRPLLVAFGVSLGSFGSQGAFSSLQDVVARTDGAVWVGTPEFTELWRELTDDRDAGSHEWSPVYRGGEHVRWGTNPGNVANVWDLGEDTWEFPRVLYMQHASDAVVWWSFDLLFGRPDWIVEPPGPDVLPNLTWLPLATFWQVSMDQFVAGGVPQGHGHNYQIGYGDAFAAVVPPDGWTHEMTEALRQAMVAIFAQDD